MRVDGRAAPQGKRTKVQPWSRRLWKWRPPPGGRESQRKAEGFRVARRGQRRGIRRGIEKGSERSDQVAYGRAADIRETRSVREEERKVSWGGAPAPTLLLNAFLRPGSNFFDRRHQSTHQSARSHRPTQSPTAAAIAGPVNAAIAARGARRRLAVGYLRSSGSSQNRQQSWSGSFSV